MRKYWKNMDEERKVREYCSKWSESLFKQNSNQPFIKFSNIFYAVFFINSINSSTRFLEEVFCCFFVFAVGWRTLDELKLGLKFLCLAELFIYCSLLRILEDFKIHFMNVFEFMFKVLCHFVTLVNVCQI